jgi:hypothetical protein
MLFGKFPTQPGVPYESEYLCKPDLAACNTARTPRRLVSRCRKLDDKMLSNACVDIKLMLRAVEVFHQFSAYTTTTCVVLQLLEATTITIHL